MMLLTHENGVHRCTRRLGSWPLWAAIAAVWVAIAVILFWIFYTPTVFQGLHQDAVVPSGQPVIADRSFQVSRSFCLDADITVTVHQEFRDGVIYQLPDFTTSLKKGCHASLTEIIVPRALPPGRYVYRVAIEYQLNLIRRASVRLPDIEFTLGHEVEDPSGSETFLSRF